MNWNSRSIRRYDPRLYFPRRRTQSRGLLVPLLVGGAAAVAGALAARAVIRSKRYYDLAGKVVLVTGSSRGLGFELARRLLARGAHVVVCARHEAELREAQEKLLGERRSPEGSVLAIPCDVTDEDQVDAMVSQVQSTLGRIDVLVNNAGTIAVGPAETMTPADYQEALQTHLHGPLRLTLAVLPAMRRRKQGRIVNITSIGGKTPAPHLLPYTVSKFALVGFSEGLRTEAAQDNVFVTTVVPGLFRSGGFRHAWFKGQDEKEFAWFSTADNLPVLTASVDRMADKVIDALIHGDAELIYPRVASLQARLHGLFPGLSTEVATLVNGLLPDAGGIGKRRSQGFESEKRAGSSS
jgi:NAD(P)-dependent dehydrogenase (short-subunit alcohol dehydrogenase family)